MPGITRNGRAVVNTTDGPAVAAAPEKAKQTTASASETKPEAAQVASEIVKASRVTEADLARAESAMDEELKGEPTQMIRLPLINKRDPYVDVGINGVIKRLQRGVTLELPMSIVEVLQHADLI